MVSVTSISNVLIADALDTLYREIEVERTDHIVERAFQTYFLKLEGPLVEWEQLLSDIVALEGAQVTYREVASLGYALSAGAGLEFVGMLRDNLVWLSGCQSTLDQVPLGFSQDAVAVLGIALGAAATKDDEVISAIATWMSTFVPESILSTRGETWQRCIWASAYNIVNRRSLLDVGDDSDAADVRVALRARNILADYETASDEAVTLRIVQSGMNYGIGSYRAAARIAAIYWIRRSAPLIDISRPTIEDVLRLLRSVPSGLQNWTWEAARRTKTGEARKWHVDNEYHVQNLLWLMLAPIFPDLQAEEYTPPVATLNPRIDLGIPSMQLIIEVKFMRRDAKSKDIVEQISADAGLYLVDGSRYSHVVAFVWDEGRKTEEHARMITGIDRIRGIAGTVVVSRPGSWM